MLIEFYFNFNFFLAVTIGVSTQIGLKTQFPNVKATIMHVCRNQ